MNSYENALKKLWDDTCDVYVRTTAVNVENGRNEPTEVCTLQGEPCRLSFSAVSSTSEVNEAALVQQVVKLFIGKEVAIPAGSRLIVHHKGESRVYKKAGESATYLYHQEIALELMEGYA